MAYAHIKHKCIHHIIYIIYKLLITVRNKKSLLNIVYRLHSPYVRARAPPCVMTRILLVYVSGNCTMVNIFYAVFTQSKTIF